MYVHNYSSVMYTVYIHIPYILLGSFWNQFRYLKSSFFSYSRGWHHPGLSPRSFPTTFAGEAHRRIPSILAPTGRQEQLMKRLAPSWENLLI